MCINYHALNKITICNCYLLPQIDDLLDQLCDASTFSILDLHSGYHQIQMLMPDILKTTFCTCYGHYKWLVLSFGMTNVPMMFMADMKMIFHDFLDDFIVIYLDDILVYSKTPKEHAIHLHKVLQWLHKMKYYAKLEKC